MLFFGNFVYADMMLQPVYSDVYIKDVAKTAKPKKGSLKDYSNDQKTVKAVATGKTYESTYAKPAPAGIFGMPDFIDQQGLLFKFKLEYKDLKYAKGMAKIDIELPGRPKMEFQSKVLFYDKDSKDYDDEFVFVEETKEATSRGGRGIIFTFVGDTINCYVALVLDSLSKEEIKMLKALKAVDVTLTPKSARIMLVPNEFVYDYKGRKCVIYALPDYYGSESIRDHCKFYRFEVITGYSDDEYTEIFYPSMDSELFIFKDNNKRDFILKNGKDDAPEIGMD